MIKSFAAVLRQPLQNYFHQDLHLKGLKALSFCVTRDQTATVVLSRGHQTDLRQSSRKITRFPPALSFSLTKRVPPLELLQFNSLSRSIHSKPQDIDVSSTGISTARPQPIAMADDSSYVSFLEKANQSTTDEDNGNAPQSHSTSRKPEALATITTSTPPPQSLRDSKHIFTSESDAAFEAVSLKHHISSSASADSTASSGLSASEFAKTIGVPKDDVEAVQVSEFESMGYGDVISTVAAEVDSDSEGKGSGAVSVFRVQRDHARVEWWVVGLHKGTILGLRATAVET